MGGNTSTIYADLYMSYCISRVKDQLDALEVKLMRKYVDDFLFYLPKANRVLSLMERATKLKFTIELPVNGVLPFLDLQLVEVDNELRLRW